MINIKRCAGCCDNYYNSANSNTGMCWARPTAKMVWKKEVPIDQRPPWNQKAQYLPSCYRRPGCVYVKPDQTSCGSSPLSLKEILR